MNHRSIRMTLLAATWLSGCQCANGDIVELDSEASSSSAEEAFTGSSTSSDGTGEPFDASRWIGRYHFENVFLPFGERGDSHGDNALINFEIPPDSRATMFNDDCSFDEGITTVYEWVPSEEGWLSLHPGPGETSLRFWANPDVDTLRVQMIDSCRALRFERDGQIVSWTTFRPGESCWVDRCTAPNIMQVDYCEGEEPPPCP
jgi:hypothetical protein